VVAEIAATDGPDNDMAVVLIHAQASGRLLSPVNCQMQVKWPASRAAISLFFMFPRRRCALPLPLTAGDCKRKVVANTDSEG
jgi:hypothetical protein